MTAHLEEDPFGQVILERILRPRNTAGFMGRRGLYYQREFGDYTAAAEPARSQKQANLVGSLDLDNANYHFPVIDLDFDALLLPSSTEGHHHLYLQKQVTHDKYLAMLEAMVDAGLVEKGYLTSARKKGQTYAIKPGLRWSGGRKGY